VAEITMDNELLYAKIATMEGAPFGPTGGRDDEPRTLAFLCSLLWSGTSCPWRKAVVRGTTVWSPPTLLALAGEVF
jgi:hypothetical protein